MEIHKVLKSVFLYFLGSTVPLVRFLPMYFRFYYENEKSEYFLLAPDVRSK